MQTISLLGNEGVSFLVCVREVGRVWFMLNVLNFLLHDTCHVVKSLENFILYE